jgi:hypothetical protein
MMAARALCRTATGPGVPGSYLSYLAYARPDLQLSLS